MPYPRKLLNTDETIVVDLHPHWWYFAEAAAALVGAIILAIIALWRMDNGSTLKSGTLWILLIAIVFSAVWLVVRYTKWATTNFVVTSDRVIFRHGVVAKSGIEIPLNRVNNVNHNQGIWERMIGSGDLLIESGGEDGQQRFTDVRHPERIQQVIHSQVTSVHKRHSAQAAAPTSVDVAEQLERLEGLRDRGSITAEEFENQKRRLLG